MKKIIRVLIQRLKNPKASIALDSWVTLSTKLGVYSKVLKGAKLGDCEIGNYSYIGENCTFERTIMGSFCSIGPEVMCGMGTHPTNHVSTYPGFYSSKGANSYFFGTEHKVEEFKPVIIQSDVWIGARAIIVCGVEIGVGAIIAAGAVVTKNVPPYAIVGGMPAKIIKYRFTEDVIAGLLKTEWWLKDEAFLQQKAQFFDNPSNFIRRNEAQ